MKVIYICYQDFSDFTSGSKVRPYKVYKTFLEKGDDVILINGRIKQRLKLFFSLLKSKAYRNADYCYVEPSTYPANPLDYIMFFYFKYKNIPMGYFYRDMYYRFPDLFKLEGLNKHILLLRYKFDLVLFKRLFKVVFFPSQLMASYFKFKVKVPLPPAGNLEFEGDEEFYHSIIYVGGINNMLGSRILLEAMDLVNNQGKKLQLNLICRDQDTKDISEYHNKSWLNVLHLSGDHLKEIYNKSDFAIIPRKRNPYFDFSMPVKLLEYMSYGKPMVVTDCTEMANFVQRNEIGIVAEDNAESLARSIIELSDSPEKLNKFRKNIRQSLLSENLWKHRINTIEEALLS
ncbi:Glycosyltransferase involved in cell wall bisynthesis [Draconibacterium orientale]|uniref:Glycosyltransferase involved in cell wall bisynthesis n=1 Tax=Draconibacterium orientale TaxID=1168034 RepID=X5E5F0_9BACT|nr:glycosyltransferase [Draconibacterium orientale]AHW61826.1 hypothetical protein FH5T_09060 [Draconibacterium orientale]SES78844.1 Glycosyltransferase involved in cell wall bisynthesis [Draconibacterium orientale]